MESEKRGNTAVGKSPVRLLEEFSKKWNVSDDVSNASIINTSDEEVIRKKHAKMDVKDSVDRNTVLSESDYEQTVSKIRPLTERYHETPIGEDGTVEFIEHGRTPNSCTECGGQGKTTCPDCGGDGQIECPKCGGSQNVACKKCEGTGSYSCSECSGKGKIENHGEMVTCWNCEGDGENQCPRCEGSGNYSCPQCNGAGTVMCSECTGSGTVICSTCDGDGKVVEATKGKISFMYSTETEFETDRIPEKYVPEEGGNKLGSTVEIEENEPHLGGRSTYRKHTASFSIPATTVEYKHEGENYELYAVGNELHADSYPKSKTRKLVRIGTIVALLALIGGGLYYLGYLPF